MAEDFDFEKIFREGMLEEALDRLRTLEEIYGINPKIERYFEQGKLYYSYITGNGMIGSIDTINYDRRYADIVRQFEEQSSSLVYHVIESGSTISLLYVGYDPSQWEEERPSVAGVAAAVVNVNSYKTQYGYIKLDVFQGALRRINDEVYETLKRMGGSDPMIDEEVVKRIKILEAAGMETGLDVAGLYLSQGELCFSELFDVWGIPVCVVNSLSANPGYKNLVENIAVMVDKELYFMMVSEDKEKLAFLYLSSDPEDWDEEERNLAKGMPEALIADLEDGSLYIGKIRLRMVNGGPLCLM